MPLRDRIVAAAEQLMLDKGLAHSTTKEIAEAVKCSEGSLYRYFRTKEDLFLAVLSERLPGLVPSLRQLESRIGTGTVGETLEEVAAAAYEFFRRSIPMFASIFAEPSLLAQHRAWMGRQNAGPHRGVALLADYLAGEQRLGRIRPEADPTYLATCLLGACHLRAFSVHFVPLDSLTDQEFCRRTVASLLDGVLAEPADRQLTRPGHGHR